MIENKLLEEKSKYCRFELTKFKIKSGTGHLASSLSCVDILVSMYYDDEVCFSHSEDFLIFGKAHGSPAVYPILADLNYFDSQELSKYCQSGGILKLHSDKSIPGCFFVGGSLGNGLGHAAGIAISDRKLKVYCILGDAELYEGSIWESLLFIAHNNLVNLTIIVDRNKLAIMGSTEKLLKLEPLKSKFESFNFDVIEVDGHNFDELRQGFKTQTEKPKIILANTIKGKGISFMEDKYEYHSIIPKKESDIEQAIKELS